MYDIYNPPPAPIPHTPPKPAPIAPRMGDLIILGFLVLGLTTISLIAWSFEPTLSVLIGLGGGLVIGESWFTGVAFLQRHPVAGRKLRWITFLAALVPWLFGLGVAASLMLALFRISDSLR